MKTIQSISLEEAENRLAELAGQTLSHVWRGHGSAMFLEFGKLTENSKGNNPVGEQTLMVDWSWRLESKTKILVGSWSDDNVINKAPVMLKDKIVKKAEFFGRIPELCFSFTDDLWFLTFMTETGYPDWSLKLKNNEWLSFDNGSFTIENTSEKQV
jgi:hypothetical protein